MAMENLTYICSTIAHQKAQSIPVGMESMGNILPSTKQSTARGWFHLVSLAMVMGMLTIGQIAIARPPLKLGDRSPIVNSIQKALGIEADGIFGPLTEAAVRDFQTKKGLVVDGQVNSGTLAALGIQIQSSSSNSVTGGTTTSAAPSSFPTAGSGIVTTEGSGLVVRREPTTSAVIMGYLDNGTAFAYTKTSVDSNGYTWLYLSDYGWVRSDFVNLGNSKGGLVQTVANQSGAGKIATGGGDLTVRRQPSTSSPVIRYMANGTRFQYDGLATDLQGMTWLRLKGVGWIRSDFVAFDQQPKTANQPKPSTTKKVVTNTQGKGVTKANGKN